MTPGQIAFTVWLTNGTPISKENACLEWECQGEKFKQDWELAVKAAIDAQPCQHPFSDVRASRNKLYTWECTQCGKEL